MKNLLIQTEELPAFENINVSDVEPTIDKLLAESRIIVQSLLANTKNYNWDNLLQTLEDMNDKLNRTWSPASHLHSVADNDQLREAYNNCISKLSDYSTEMGQNEELFHAYEQIAGADSFKFLSNDFF